MVSVASLQPASKLTDQQMQELEARLLATSYIMSARRIALALSSSQEIISSVVGGEAPASTDVIGLCGQGGRHEYFKMPVTALVAGLQTILAANEEDPVYALLDTVAAGCQQMLDATVFNRSTNCINDQAAGVVGLLPPEEIWLNGRQLPIELWRMLSFNYDLNAIAADAVLRRSAIGTGRLSSASTAFGDLMRRLGGRAVSFEVSEDKMPVRFQGRLQPPGNISVPLWRLFWEAGVLLTPLRGSAITPWYAAVRYADWIAPTSSGLEIRDEYKLDNVDSRYRGLAAEELAVGVMSLLLQDRFECQKVYNTSEVVAAADRRSLIADFVADGVCGQQGTKFCIVAESKGSLRKKVSAKRKAHAKDQVSATNPVITGCTDLYRFSFCTRIVYTSQQAVTLCEVSDPAGDDDVGKFRIDPVVVWRQVYAKLLHFIGLSVAAMQVADGQPALTLRASLTEIGNSENDFFIDRILNDKFRLRSVLNLGDLVVVADRAVLDLLSSGIQETIELERILQAIPSRRLLSQDSARPHQSFVSAYGFGIMDVREFL